MSEHGRRVATHRKAPPVAAIYAVVATAWILASDLLIGPDAPSAATGYDLLKGLGFVLVTSVTLHLLLQRSARHSARLAEQYRTLAEQAPDLIYRLRLRPQLRFEYVSPASESMTGYTPEELYADAGRLLDAVHPDDRDRLQALLAEPAAIPDVVELRWRHEDGHIVWSDNRFAPVRGEDGEVVGIQGITRDITRRKEAQQRNELLATAVEAAGEAVIITDPKGRIDYVNPAFTEISGYELHEVAGLTPRVLKSGRQSEAYYQELWATIAAGRTFRGDMVNRRKDGRLYDQECTINPVTDDLGRVTHFVAVARDVTIQREMDERVRVAQKMQAVAQLAAGIAHDFRNLLSVIQINAERLREGTVGRTGEPTILSEEDAARIEEVWAQAERGAALVGKLLTVGRRDELHLAPLDLGAAIVALQPTFRTLLPAEVTLRVDVAHDLPAIYADATAVEQILLNLVANARDALENGGRVEIRVEEVRAPTIRDETEDPRVQRGRYVRLAVEDSGAGMDADTLRHAFEPFYTTKPEGKGTGLGLATVRSLVERHGGVVSVQSRPGSGTVFELFLPAAPESAPTEEPATPRVHGPPTDIPRGSETILLVEDEEALRKAAARILGELGYRVTTARDGVEAMEWLSGEEREVDLVVTDLLMPRMGGLALFERSRERGWPLPFLFMSGYGSEDVSWHPNPDRLRVVLEKPWTMHELAHRVREVLDG